MKAYYFENDRFYIIDTTLLPFKETYIEIDSINTGYKAIKEMKVRGAPMIGVVAAFAVAAEIKNKKVQKEDIKEGILLLEKARPTANNLFYTLNRIVALLNKKNWKNRIVSEAKKILEEEEIASQKIAEFGEKLLPQEGTVLTHCNTGSLAAPGNGTALGVIIEALKKGKKLNILITETRPRFQGARLTAYELNKRGIPFTLITDGAAPFLINEVDAVIIGADRIALNGDTANKVGSFSLSLGAKYYGKKFYIAAPLSTIDFNIASGKFIKIEERNGEEVLKIYKKWITLKNTRVKNIAFDVVPWAFISAIITDKGVIKKPFKKNISNLVNDNISFSH